VTFAPNSILASFGDYCFSNCPTLSRICLPRRLAQLDSFCLVGPTAPTILIPKGSSLLKVAGCFLLDFDGISIKRYFGTDPELTVPNAIENLGAYCCATSESLEVVTFELGAKVSRIENQAFFRCSSLESICIPSSVTHLGRSCFAECHSLSAVTFEASSKLSVIETSAFFQCRRLRSMSIPSSITKIFKTAFADCMGLSKFTIESDSELASIPNDFLIDCQSLSSIWISPARPPRFLFKL
jgi:hypothetical protein